MSIWRDFKYSLVYGTPHTLAFVVVHSALFFGVDVDSQINYQASITKFQNGQYYTMLTQCFMHGSLQHLISNSLSFIVHCYPLIGRIDKQNKLKTSLIFWSTYIASGIIAAFGWITYQMHYKNMLLWYYQHNKQIITDINQRFDTLNEHISDTNGCGASGCIAGITSFDFCFSLELVLKRIYHFYESFIKDKGLIDIDDDDNDVDNINMKFDILDYDLGETTKGEDDINEIDINDIDEITTKKVDYHALRFGLDCCLSLFCGYSMYKELNKVYVNWKYGEQNRGYDLLKIEPMDRISHETHVFGIISGFLMYSVYKLANVL